MATREQSNNRIQTYLVVGIALLVLCSLWGWRHYQKQSQEHEYIDAQLGTVVHAKQRTFESLFTNLYQNLRTISLLPSVRSISGANRNDEKEDVVVGGRFTPEGRETVQQIYNNLSANVSVSEVYGVLEGLDSSKGQVPFFMYDTLLFGDHRTQENKSTTPDTPDESEDAEYAFFPQQMAAIRQAHATFHFAGLDEIPAFGSPLMRTCDNAQYISKSNGDVNEAFGMLYSVPFYDAKTQAFKGVISGIVRRNVLEAALLGVPFIPVTNEDISTQKKESWSLPEPSRFMLSNAKLGITIADRRNPELPRLLMQGMEGRNTFHIPLSVHSDSPWVLSYYLPESSIQEAMRDSDRAFAILALVVVCVLGVAIAALSLLRNIRTAVQEVGEVFSALAQGDFTRRVQAKHSGALAQLTLDSNRTIDHLNDIVFKIRDASDTVIVAATQIASGTANISQRTGDQVQGLKSASSSIEQLTSSVKESADKARQANTHAQDASQVAVEGGGVVGNVVQTMREIHASSSKISEIISVIDGIAFQTNILALNAAVEAARAGEQGRGFAVVAAEVRALAQRSANAAREIKDLITDSVSKVAAGTDLVDQAGNTMSEVVASIERTSALMADISRATASESDNIDQVNLTIRAMDGSTQENSAMAAQAAAAARDLQNMAQGLQDMVAQFKLEH